MKVIIDTSTWLEYFKGKADPLEHFLMEGNALTHSIVLGELACGNFKHRQKTLRDLHLLPRAKEADFQETLDLIETHRLYGKGLGFNDVQLLASALLSECSLFSYDKTVIRTAKSLGISI
jgi:predicted nucleic acid-binding protein